MFLSTETVLGLMKYDQPGITWKNYGGGVSRDHLIHAAPSAMPGCQTRAPSMARAAPTTPRSPERTEPDLSVS